MSMTRSVKTARNAQLMKQVKKHVPFYFFLLPALVLVVVFCYFPMWGIVIAFKDYKMARGILGSEWVGLYHFKRYSPIRIFTGYWGIRLKSAY